MITSDDQANSFRQDRAGYKPLMNRKGHRKTDGTKSSAPPQADDPDFNVPGNDVDLKAPMSPREHRFLELCFFSGQKITKYEAAKKAGYNGKSKQALCNTARRIIQKYESVTDPREIFRRIGLGEAQVASRLLAMADDTAIPPSVRLQALATASKCLGLQREAMEGAAGAQIIINPTRTVDGPDPVIGHPGAQGQPSTPSFGGQPGQVSHSKGPISIVR